MYSVMYRQGTVALTIVTKQIPDWVLPERSMRCSVDQVSTFGK